MADTIISVENLGKKYRLGVARHDTLRDRLMHAVRAPFRRHGTGTSSDPQEFWALQDVSFEVKRGEVLGIIGRNGAGKSTLLKILSRITEPTKGRISIRGRVASLLEVGTGFHPELSGRENIFLNGAVLGMTRVEIRRKFDEIVAFAEVERFLDTPVKHYSSGMYVRLAFAVAAHLEPEILIVDEVLAVGDAAFQNKCLGKIESLTHSDERTVLLVTHNMVSVQQLCRRVLHLHGGRVTGDGPTFQQVRSYLGSHSASPPAVMDLTSSKRTLEPRGAARMLSAQLRKGAGCGPWQLPFGESLRFRIQFEAKTTIRSFELGLGLFNIQGQEIVSALSSWQQQPASVSPGRYGVEVDYGELDLAPGVYRFGVGISSDRGLEDYLPEAFQIEVIALNDLRPNLRSIGGAIAHTAKFTIEQDF